MYNTIKKLLSNNIRVALAPIVFVGCDLLFEGVLTGVLYKLIFGSVILLAARTINKEYNAVLNKRP